jgi:hypothetical protein
MPTTKTIERELEAVTKRLAKREARLEANTAALKEKREKFAGILNALSTQIREDEAGLTADRESVEWWKNAPVSDAPVAADTSDPFAEDAPAADADAEDAPEAEDAGTPVTKV